MQYGKLVKAIKKNRMVEALKEQKGLTNIQVIYYALGSSVGDEERKDDGIPALSRNIDEKE